MRRWHFGEPLGEEDSVVPQRVKIPDARGFAVAASLIEPARGGVVVARRRLDDEKSRFTLSKPPLDLLEEQSSATGSLEIRMHGDPIEVVYSIGARRGAVAHVADELFAPTAIANE